MHISWLGTTAVKIQAKPFDKDIVLLIDPYKPKTGAFPRNLTAQIVLYTRGDKDSITISGAPFVLSIPGECETNGILITSAQGNKEDDVIFRIDAEEISVGHLGLANKSPSDEQLKVLSGVDILFVPVGGGAAYDAEQAIKAANAIEPRIIIPMNYHSDNDPKADKVNSFLKEMGAAGAKAEKKVILKKKDLPQDDTQVILLSKE